MPIEPVSFSPNAIAEIKSIMDNKGIPDEYCLRIGMKGSGCGGMGYVIGFDKVELQDIKYLCDEVPVIVDKRHVMYLIDLEVDFHESEHSRGFIFNKKS